MTAPAWLTYAELAARLGLPTATAAAARARRAKWAKRLRNTDNVAEVLVPGDVLATTQKRPVEPRSAPALPEPTPTLDAAVRAIVGPLQAMLDRETQDRRTLQGQSDALRDQLAASQLDAAKATGAANTERARREAAEARAADLKRQVEALEARQRRRWWRL